MDISTRIGLGGSALFTVASFSQPLFGWWVAGPAMAFSAAVAVWGFWPLRPKRIWPFNYDKSDRISLHDFIFVESPKVGWQRDGQDDTKGYMTLVARLEQAASDGEIHFWGRMPRHFPVGDDNQPLLSIPPEHWGPHQIDLLSAIFKPNANNFSCLRFSATESVGYRDLHLTRRESLKWLRSRGRP